MGRRHGSRRDCGGPRCSGRQMESTAQARAHRRSPARGGAGDPDLDGQRVERNYLASPAEACALPPRGRCVAEEAGALPHRGDVPARGARAGDQSGSGIRQSCRRAWAEACAFPSCRAHSSTPSRARGSSTAAFCARASSPMKYCTRPKPWRAPHCRARKGKRACSTSAPLKRADGNNARDERGGHPRPYRRGDEDLCRRAEAILGAARPERGDSGAGALRADRAIRLSTRNPHCPGRGAARWRGGWT